MSKISYKSQSEILEIAEIKDRINTLRKLPRSLIGSDQGTHGKPLNHSIYEEIDGTRYATASFANSNATRCTVESAEEDTEGRIRWFTNAIQEMKELRAELAKLEKQLRKLEAE